jgi:hypothetical protein
MKRGGGMRRYSPRWTYPDEPVTPAEHHALKIELWVMMFLVAVMLLATFAEALMDVLCAMLGVR